MVEEDDDVSGGFGREMQWGERSTYEQTLGRELGICGWMVVGECKGGFNRESKKLGGGWEIGMNLISFDNGFGRYVCVGNNL